MSRRRASKRSRNDIPFKIRQLRAEEKWCKPDAFGRTFYFTPMSGIERIARCLRSKGKTWIKFTYCLHFSFGVLGNARGGDRDEVTGEASERPHAR
jgi:hypothetical protein